MYTVIEYLKFLLRATNHHGVHSPFVYELLTKGLYPKLEKPLKSKYTAFRKSLFNNSTTIQVSDFGAGSRVFKTNTRKVKDIVKYAGIRNKRGQALIKLTNYFKPNTILEIGTSVGLGTAALAIGNPKATLITLEGCENTASVAKDAFKKHRLSTITVQTGNFSKSLPQVLQNNTFDCVYFDGNHQKEATLNYFEQCLAHVHNDTLFLFDDIYWSPEMTAAWQDIKNHPKVRVTIDTFYWGIVFFRKEQAKEHFTIRL